VHIRIKGSGAALASYFQQENKFLKAYREKAKEGREGGREGREIRRE